MSVIGSIRLLVKCFTGPTSEPLSGLDCNKVQQVQARLRYAKSHALQSAVSDMFVDLTLTFDKIFAVHYHCDSLCIKIHI